MTEDKNKTIVDRVWGFFSSVTLAVVIFAFIGLTSIIGTIIEQNVEREKNLELIGNLFGNSNAETLYGIFNAMGFMDMYHSWWFVTLLLLFSANLIICSIDRLPRILKLITEPLRPLSEEQFKNIGKKEIVLKGRPEKIKEAVGAAIKDAGFNHLEAKEAGGYQLYAEKGNYTRLGVYITHFSILLILLGALLGIFFGFKGFIPLPEGASTNAVETRNGQEQRFDFNIRCDRFEVDFYGNSDMPRAYKSWLTVIKNGQEVVKKVIEVNSPLTYEGVTFYQSSYGTIPGSEENGIFSFKTTSKNGKTAEMSLRLGDSFTIPGTNITGKIENFSPALGIDPATGKAFTYAEQMNNPAVYIDFYENNTKKYGGWILKRRPDTWELPDGNMLELTSVRGIQYTGLQVRKDPGVWVVYLGCIAMAIGLFSAFFMSHKKIWVRLTEGKNGTRIALAFTANKNRPAFEAKIDKIISLLNVSGGGGK